MNDDFRELGDALDLEFWLERESIAFRRSQGRSGMQFNVRECPNCGNTSYRVYLNAETGLGNCFVCSEGFHKLKFIHKTLQEPPWRETLDHVRICLKEQGWRPRRTTTMAVNVEKAKFPNSFELPTPDGENLKYLETRGITPEFAKYFHLRYCDRGKWEFTRDDGTRGFQKFDGRVIIPVYDLDGEFVTYQGRDILNTTDKKYLFPKGLPGTGRYLLNGQNAQHARRVCMGEGAFDVMATKAALDEEVELRDVVPVGSFGKHLSYGSMDGDDQLGRFLKLKGMGLQEVTIMWDGEWKAVISALDAAELLQRIGIKVRIALLPKDRDPNEVLPEVVRKAFWSALPYTKALAVRWRLRNPFIAETSVSIA